MSERPMLPIPIEAAEQTAKTYGYDRVVIIARRVGAPALMRVATQYYVDCELRLERTEIA